jgi:hypothetical protein
MTTLDSWKLRSIAEVAPTLDALKKFPPEKQAILLLRRLATAYGARSFGKMNFELAGYAAHLTHGYPPIEASRVKPFLLGAPWVYLMTHGYIRDNGHSFFTVTEEGLQAAQNADQTIVSMEIRSAIQLLHPDFADYEHYFQRSKRSFTQVVSKRRVWKRHSAKTFPSQDSQESLSQAGTPKTALRL